MTKKSDQQSDQAAKTDQAKVEEQARKPSAATHFGEPNPPPPPVAPPPPDPGTAPKDLDPKDLAAAQRAAGPHPAGAPPEGPPPDEPKRALVPGSQIPGTPEPVAPGTKPPLSPLEPTGAGPPSQLAPGTPAQTTAAPAPDQPEAAQKPLMRVTLQFLQPADARVTGFSTSRVVSRELHARVDGKVIPAQVLPNTQTVAHVEAPLGSECEVWLVDVDKFGRRSPDSEHTKFRVEQESLDAPDAPGLLSVERVH